MTMKADAVAVTTRPVVRYGQSYETVFSVFLAILAFLWRDNPNMVYPQILYLLSALLALNLGAGASLRLWPGREWLCAFIILGNCAVITASLAYSGGPGSNLWVLYLLPIYTACMFLRGREVVWITAGAVGFNALYHFAQEFGWSDASVFLVALKSGIFVFAAATTYRIVRKDREHAARLGAQAEALRRSEADNAQQQQRLERAEPLAEVGMASSGVAHDLKNPLLVLLGTAEMLLQNDDFPGRFRPELERMQRSASLCRDIASGVLGLAQNRRLSRQRCGLNAIISAGTDMLAGALAEAKVDVRLELGEDLPSVEVCPFELQRVFLNLLSNAKDAMPEGGTVTLFTAAASPELPGGPTRVLAVVEDTGPGIGSEVLKRLFTPFATSKEPGKGTGLGLYLCREIAFRHGGWLNAENVPGGGARFTLSLPAVVRSGAVLEPALSSEA